VRQIVLNLLTNAVKFTHDGGAVRVTCGSTHIAGETDGTGAMTWIAVEDTGIGIEQGELDRIFRPFTQVEGGHTRSYGGTGLGLNISRQLAQLMDGELTVASQPGVGSRFTLWLPGGDAQPRPLEEIVKAELRARAPANLTAVAQALLANAPALIEQFTARVRSDARIPTARDVGFADLADHTPAFLADVSQSLILLESGQVLQDQLLQDGSEIQGIIAGLHGRQRAQLGWSSDALAREWQILREEIATVVRMALPTTDDTADAMRLLNRFIERAERIAGRALHHARAMLDGP
jgi:hypothetical protein